MPSEPQDARAITDAQALARCVTEHDAGWVMDHYLGLTHPLDQYEMLPLIAGLPAEQTLRRLKAEASGDRGERPGAVEWHLSRV